MQRTKELKRPKMSESMKGKQVRLGKKMTEEGKIARIERMKERNPGNLTPPNRIPILDLETNTAYESITHAARSLGICMSQVYKSVRYKQEVSPGKIFVRIDQMYPEGF